VASQLHACTLDADADADADDRVDDAHKDGDTVVDDDDDDDAFERAPKMHRDEKKTRAREEHG